MAITTSAKKAIRGSERKKVFNDRRKKALKEAVKSKRIKFDMKKFQRYAKKFNLDLDTYILTVTT